MKMSSGKHARISKELGIRKPDWVRFTDKTELCWSLQTAHVLREADLSDWKTGDCKQLKLYAENAIGWPE